MSDLVFPRLYIAIDIGCIECGEPSALVGVFATRREAEEANRIAAEKQEADWHGQHSFEIFEADIPAAVRPLPSPPTHEP